MTDAEFGSTMQQFLLWEAASRDTIDFKKIYVDIAEDLIAGLMLSQIIYWHLPDRNGESKLRVERDDEQWLVKAQHEWWSECRLTAKQIRRARKILEDKGIIVTAVYKFGGAPTTHIRIDWDAFLKQWTATLYGQIHFDQRDKSILTKSQNPNLPKGKIEIDQRAGSLTETTNTDQPTEKTTETPPTPVAPNPFDEKAGGGGEIKNTDAAYSFLVEKCGVWESKAKQLVADNLATLELVAHWWTVLKKDENIRNRAAVLIHHLENREQPPDFVDERQRHRFQQYLWEYESPNDLEEDDEAK
jgi:hypothetical protein